MEIESFCDYPFVRCRLTSEGNMCFCCFMRSDPLSNESEAYIGNVLNSTFDDVWFGPEAEKIRQDTLAGVLSKKCQCPGCPYVCMNTPYPVKNVIYGEYPSFLEIDLPNTHCNVGGLRPNVNTSPACIMCERSSPHFRPEQNHLFQVLDKIKHIVPCLSQIHIQGISEPFYQTREDGYLLFDVLDALDFDAHAHKITISVTTNGTLFKKSVRSEYLKRIPHSITNFSIDAATPETFKKIRIFDCFDKVIENLCDFSEERDETQQFLRIHNNINIHNVDEVVGMVYVAHKAKVDCVEFNATNGFNKSILVQTENCGKFYKAQNDVISACKSLNVPYNFIRPLDLGMTEQLIQLTI
jgi:hypothetical protein